MTSEPTLDLDRLRTWIGKVEHADDIVTPALVQRFRATLDQDAYSQAVGAVAPPLIHWCLPSPAAGTSALDRDGHPQRGGFLPPITLPRRMWAGGRLEFFSPIRISDTVSRHSRIADISFKQGRSGRLCFLTIDHEISAGQTILVRERQDIVYGDFPSRREITPEVTSEISQHQSEYRKPGAANAALLFRYSALTFNAHRIHYDRVYASEVEGYEGLVVQGPLQATLLMEMSCALRGCVPKAFEFRALRPLFEGPFVLSAGNNSGVLRLSVLDGNDRQTMTASSKGDAFEIEDNAPMARWPTDTSNQSNSSL